MPEKSHTDKVNLFAGKMPHGIALLMFLAAAFPQQSYPLEIFLNDNRSETGTIGFIDIDKVFSSYSGTASSKKMFEKEVKRKEEELARRNTRIYKKKAQAAKLRQEKELASMIPEMLEARQKIERAKEQLKQDKEKLIEDTENAKKEAENLKKQQLESEKQRMILEYRQMGMPEEDLQKLLKEKYPENQTDTENLEQNGIKTEAADAKKAPEPSLQTKKEGSEEKETVQREQKNGISLSDTEKTAYESVSMPALPRSKFREKDEEDENKKPLYMLNIPGIGDFSFSVSTETAKIQEELKKLEQQIQSEEESAKKYEEQAEKELAEYEEAQTRQILGKIYSALKQLAHKEEISVVVDKRNILYGKRTVDLTQKLISLLETPEEE